MLPDKPPSPPASSGPVETVRLPPARLLQRPHIDSTAELLRCYGIPLAELTPARSEDEAVSAFEAAADPVVLKADVPGVTPYQPQDPVPTHAALTPAFWGRAPRLSGN